MVFLFVQTNTINKTSFLVDIFIVIKFNSISIQFKNPYLYFALITTNRVKTIIQSKYYYLWSMVYNY